MNVFFVNFKNLFIFEMLWIIKTLLFEVWILSPLIFIAFLIVSFCSFFIIKGYLSRLSWRCHNEKRQRFCPLLQGWEVVSSIKCLRFFLTVLIISLPLEIKESQTCVCEVYQSAKPPLNMMLPPSCFMVGMMYFSLQASTFYFPTITRVIMAKLLT